MRRIRPGSRVFLDRTALRSSGDVFARGVPSASNLSAAFTVKFGLGYARDFASAAPTIRHKGCSMNRVLALVTAATVLISLSTLAHANLIGGRE